MHDGGEFDGNIATADNGQALRQFRQKEHLVRGQAVFGDAGTVLRLERPSAGSDQDRPGRHFAFRAVRPYDDERMFVLEGCVAHQHLGAGARKIAEIDAGQAGQFGLVFVAKMVPVEGAGMGIPAETAGMAYLFRNFGSINHEFFGDAATQHTGATRTVLFGDGHLESHIGRQPRSAYAPGTGAHYEQVIVKLNHGLFPDRLSRMKFRFFTGAECLRPLRCPTGRPRPGRGTVRDRPRRLPTSTPPPARPVHE